ncbi:MAG: response regulator [Calditrichaeota bacterium]|nr:response regulator [Calditrichota bacterium]RQW07497.1 MAG: response regulator [Calditrichota bacterium]
MEEQNQKSVLIIEDDIDYGEMLAYALKHMNYNVHLSYSATGGLDIIRQKKLDIILSDLKMPGMSGMELARRVIKMYLDIPIVLITGLSDISLVKQAVEIGVSDYIVKPVSIEELPVVIERNIYRKSLQKRVLQDNKAETLLKALKALMRALDAKDPYTYGHSQRVVKLAMRMADKLNLENGQRYTLQLSASLHDIGKIGMPDNILKKADSLEDIEMNKAKDHPRIGSEILGEIEELSEVASIVRHHHERFDGKGYPDGLRGEAIPFFSRILFILDAYEALASDRVYRKGMGMQKSLEVIEKNAGSQFDPYLVKVFIETMNENSSNETVKKASDENISASAVKNAG